MRSILVDWLIEVHRKFELMPETLYLTLNIVDRFLSIRAVPRRELQLVGISSMLIASKYEKIWAPEVNDFVLISDNAYIREQVLVMEKTILRKLEWYLTVPTPYVFLVRDCAKLMASFHVAAPESKLRAVYKKFSSMDRSFVALRAPAKNLPLKKSGAIVNHEVMPLKYG